MKANFDITIFVALLIYVWGQVELAILRPQDGVDNEQELILHRQKRKVVSKDIHFWPNGVIPYFIDESVARSFNLMTAIDDSILIIERDTCLRFKKVTQEDLDAGYGDKHRYVRFVLGGSCHSAVGRGLGPGAQDLVLSKACGFPEMVLHEIGHVIGFWHEQARADRDAHVRINWANIENNREFNFKLVPDARLWAPYDLSSAMHYNLKLFKKNDERTIDPFDNSLSFMVGYQPSFSYYDLATIHRMYKCAVRCPKDTPLCQNEGFLNEDCECVCPRLLSGETCEEVISDEDCGGIFEIDSSLTLTSPNYPEYYGERKNCVWMVKSPPGTFMSLDIHDFSFERTQTMVCRDQLELRLTHLGIERGAEFCGEYVNEQVETETNTALLHMLSGKAVGRDTRGFNITLTVHQKEDCDSSPCQHGGTCMWVEPIHDYMCKCPDHHIGKNCELKVLDGGLSEWSAWSTCAAACGFQHRHRTCTDPRPENGGLDCTGVREEMQRCDSGLIDCTEQYVCDFGTKDNLNDCGITSQGVSKLEWAYHHDNTPSRYTGPDAGHTTGDANDYYIYMEGSYGVYEEDTTFWLPARHHSPGIYCLQFFSFLRGKDVGTLQAIRRYGASPPSRKEDKRVWTVIWQYSTDQGEGWIETDIDVLLFGENIQLGFRGIKGDGFESDIAVDDISISPGACEPSVTKKVKYCTLYGEKYSSGNHFTIIEKECIHKQCFCNFDGTIDCPIWDESNQCKRRQNTSGKKSSTAKKVAAHKRRQREKERRRMERKKKARLNAAAKQSRKALIKSKNKKQTARKSANKI